MLLVKPISDCNLECLYCYEQGVCRDRHYNLDAILNRIDEFSQAFPQVPICIHGGEATLIPIDDLTALFKKAASCGHPVAVQTNGVEIGSSHADLFLKYDVGVGVSLDGLTFGENIYRHPDPETTSRVISNIRMLREVGVSVGISVVIHDRNCHISGISDMVQFCNNVGIKSLKLAPVFPPDGSVPPYLPKLDNLQTVYKFGIDSAVLGLLGAGASCVIQPMYSMLQIVCGNIHPHLRECTFGLCPRNITPAGIVVDGGGVFRTCDCREPEVVKGLGDTPDYSRYTILRKKPQDDGGCAKCDVWKWCLGGCPAHGSCFDDDGTIIMTHNCRDMWCDLYRWSFNYIQEMVGDDHTDVGNCRELY